MDAGLHPSLVSDAADVGIIQKRIIENLYFNRIVVCDVSGKNPNVMFELGLRLAFDKPTIIVKDNRTSYTFDTSPIEHLEYRRDLRIYDTIAFKNDLTGKIKATLDRSETDKSFSQFLRAFGDFSVVKLSETEVTRDQFIMQELTEVRRELRQIAASKPTEKSRSAAASESSISASEGFIVEVRALMTALMKEFIASCSDIKRQKPIYELLNTFRARVPISVYVYLKHPENAASAGREMYTSLTDDYGISPKFN